MPGPIKDRTADQPEDADPNRPLMRFVDGSPGDPATWPSTEGYITHGTYTVNTQAGPKTYDDPHWTLEGLRRWLRVCPEEIVFVNLEPNEVGRPPEEVRPYEVYFCGYRFAFPKGRSVWVPAPIATIIKQCLNPEPSPYQRNTDLYTINDADAPGPQGYHLGVTHDLRG